MTVSFKKSLKPVPEGWVAVDPIPNFDSFYQDLKAEIKGLTNAEEPSMYIYSLVVLTTKKETTPKWGIWDTNVTLDTTKFVECFKAHKEMQEHRLKEGSITGFQIISSKVSNNIGICQKLEDYCITQFEPKPKVYINGPKKDNEFLTKKAKQYANAKSI